MWETIWGMARKTLSKEIEAIVLLFCRRRCCICYGLNRDTSLKKGQIAHLDGNSNNNELDNLAFLCLDHHDQYDSRTSQSKSFTVNEVRSFRKELHEAIELIWKQPITFGEVHLDSLSKISGHYIRDGEFDSAELDVEYLGAGRVRVRGFALWGKTREYGPNIGELDFEEQIKNSTVTFNDRATRDKVYRVKITFKDQGLTVGEDYVIGYFGMNVSFEGDYVRAS
jgi:hypothetical protein